MFHRLILPPELPKLHIPIQTEVPLVAVVTETETSRNVPNQDVVVAPERVEIENPREIEEERSSTEVTIEGSGQV